jgi:hypothetical protein
MKRAKGTWLTTLGTLAVSLNMVAGTPAEAAKRHQYELRCEYIQKLKKIAVLQRIASNPRDECAAVALERIVELTSGGVVYVSGGGGGGGSFPIDIS